MLYRVRCITRGQTTYNELYTVVVYDPEGSFTLSHIDTSKRSSYGDFDCFTDLHFGTTHFEWLADIPSALESAQF